MPEHPQADLRPLGKPAGKTLPFFSAVGRAVDREMVADVLPGLTLTIFNHRVDGVGMLAVQCYGKTEFGGEIVLNVYPVLARIHALVDAAVVLLVEDVWIGGMLYETMDTLAVLGVDIREEAGAS